MSLCPYCHAPLKGAAALPPMSKRQAIIYDMVLTSAHHGCSHKQLLDGIYEGKNQPPGAGIVLRVAVHELNKLLIPVHQRVAGRRGIGYVLVSTKDS